MYAAILLIRQLCFILSNKMREYTIKFLDSDGEIEDESHRFQLENSATVSILKEAFQKEVEEYKPDQLRLFFRKENGQKIGLDDDDILSEVIGDQAGQILAECEPLGVLSGKIWIHKDFNEEVFVLVGTPKRFDHYKVYRSQGSNYTVPIGKILQFLCKNQHYTCLKSLILEQPSWTSFGLTIRLQLLNMKPGVNTLLFNTILKTDGSFWFAKMTRSMLKIQAGL